MSVVPAREHLVYVEYCTGCGFTRNFSELKSRVQKELPYVRLIGNRQPPRMSQHTHETHTRQCCTPLHC